MKFFYSETNPYIKQVIFTTIILFWSSFNHVKSQNYVTIGTGTFSSTASSATPYSTSFDDGRQMYLVLASELGVTGAAGNIVSIGWDVTSLSTQALNGFTIKISTTPFTVLPATFPASTTTVYAPPSAVQPVLGWNQYTFSVPYIWNGTDNLIIQVCYDNSTSSSVNYGVKCAYQVGYSYGAVANNSSGCSLTGPGAAYWRPNIRFEFPEHSNDAGVTELVNPVFPTCAMDSLVKVKIKNYGLDSLTSLNINWSINGLVQSSVSYSNSIGLPPLTFDTISLGTVASGLTDGDSIMVWSTMPNGSVDSNNVNDTLLSVVYNSLSGTYVIDPNGLGDFTSFSDAVNALDDYGVCGSTVFEANDGIYNEQIELESFIGMDTMNTVTFRSQSGNRDNVILQYTSSSTADNYVVKMFDADNFVFEDMTIWAQDTAYATGLHLWGADNFTINNCVIKSHYGANYNGKGIYAYYYNNGAYASSDNFTVTNCTFDGGYYNLYYYNYSSARAQGAIIENNEFLNAHYYGAYVYYVDDLQLNNNYVNSNTTNAYGYAFYINQVANGSISSNYVEGTINWPRVGMYTYAVNGDLSTFMPITNNRIYVPNPNGDYGIHSSNSLFTEYAHNSISFEGDSFGSAFYVNNGSYNLIKNNIIQTVGSGYGIYYSGQGIYQMDYNNLSAPNGNIGYSGGTQSNLGNWQTVTGFDPNSVTVNNAYSNPVTLKVCTDSLYEKGTNIPVYAEDFEGDLRQNPPCIGADEFMPISEFGFDNPVLCNGDTLILRQDYFDTVVWNTIDTSNTLVVTTAGPQSLAVYDACGSDTLSFIVDVPIAAFIGDTNLCEGTSAVLKTGISNGTYLWSTGSMDSAIMVNSAQVVFVDVVDAFGCSSSDTAIITQSYNVNLPDSVSFCEGASVILDAGMAGVYIWSDGSTNQTLGVSISGVYAVTVVDQNCISSSSSVVNEILNPIAMFSDSSDQMVVLFTNTSQNATSYVWDFGDGTTSTDEHPTHIYPWDPWCNTYTVTLTAFNSCGSSEFVNDGVRVSGNNYGPPSGINYNVDNTNNWLVSFGLGNAGPGTYLWDFGDGGTSILAHPTHLYTSTSAYECYNVTLVYDGCILDSFEMEIAAGNYPSSDPCDLIDGVEEVMDKTNFQIYPNPNNGNFSLRMNLAETKNVTIQIFSPVGNQILNNELGIITGDVNHQISINRNAPGLYLIKVIVGDEEFVEKVVLR